MTILIVDDEVQMRQLLTMCLQTKGFDVDEAASGYECLQKLMQKSYDLIILDIMMPHVDGFEVLKQIREKLDKNVPVVMLTALGDTDTVVKGLANGADDYVIKPFEPRELVARIDSVLRRVKREAQQEDVLLLHGLLFENSNVAVSYKGQKIPLTKKEFRIIYRMAKHPERVYSREQLLELEWGHDYQGDTRTVDAHIKNIREKLNEAGFTKPIIQTVWGIGYQMKAE